MHKTEPSRLQSLSLQLSEKVAMLVENNERILEAKQGGGFFFQKQSKCWQIVEWKYLLDKKFVNLKYCQYTADRCFTI